ncbi:MAG: DUF3667 domain-containing protein [Sphingomicrobium sp.]
MPLLIWHPGRLTRRYIAGQRATYVSPLALFLFSVFLMFAVFSAIGGLFTFEPPTMRNTGSNNITAIRADGTSVADDQILAIDGVGDAYRWLNAGYIRAKQNPPLLFCKLQTNAYKFSWALIPLSLPFVWLLFLHRRRYRRDYGAYDHLVFVTYSTAFMSLGMMCWP